MVVSSTKNEEQEYSASLIKLCSDLRPQLAERASKYDQDGSFPVENFELLKEAGLLGIMIPKKFGGLGADFYTYTRALEQLAMGDSSTALTFNMHNISVGTLAEIELEGVGGSFANRVKDFCKWAYDETIIHKRVFASASSEPGIGAHFSKFKTSYKRVKDGFVINGEKSFVSMAGYADYYVVAARSQDIESDSPAISFLIVEKDNPGIEFTNIWDVLGMRATATNPMKITDCVVPESALFLGSEGMALSKIAREPHWLVGGYIGVYLGICSATFQFLVDFLKKKKQPGTSTPMADDRLIQYRVGELYSRLEAVRAVVYRAARLVDQQRGSPEANEAIHNAKYLVGELGPSLASHAIRLCGASSIAKRLPLERYYRDARCGGLMPASSDDCLSYLGKAAFGADLTKISETYW